MEKHEITGSLLENRDVPVNNTPDTLSQRLVINNKLTFMRTRTISITRMLEYGGDQV